jgi:hypothetical protein
MPAFPTVSGREVMQSGTELCLPGDHNHLHACHFGSEPGVASTPLECLESGILAPARSLN